MSSPRSPAETLAAVLRVLTPEALITVRGRYVEHHYYSDSHDFDASDKNHLAHIVAMLDERQQAAFENYLSDIWVNNEAPDNIILWAITMPASAWLSALAAATLRKAD